MSGAMHIPREEGRVVALCGGVGGAKLAFGLQKVLGSKLHVVINMADDFEHLGLHISPDLDTVLYTLGGLNDRQRGWGRADESWNFMEAIGQIGGETWFALGDRDLALHVERTRRLANGESLTQIVQDIARNFGITAHLWPVTDDPVRTVVVTPEEELAFQRYFVALRCEPAVRAIRFDGAESARLAKGVRDALQSEGLRMIIICPSNPFLSIDPILAAPGLREALRAADVPIVAVSPLVAGQAVKGPTRKIMDELQVEATTASIAAHYGDLIDGLVIDVGDVAEGAALSVAVHAAPTLMTDDESKIELARNVLAFGDALARTARKETR
ncbi:lppg:fo 2-phospho-l-lactate transferase [Afipia carboxidovorans OM5]|nr:2-phospho-L-lactate transferase [Afipia carboxidovorans]ACI92140.1 lppg:fo 2-phospho-l-lactate transferase [Afipia carboxidovorans OM5]